MKRSALLIALFLPLFCRAAATHWTDFTLDRGHVFLPVTIEGIESRVMLDSGAQINSINKAFIGKHDLELDGGRAVKIQGVYKIEKRSTFNNVKVNIFGSDFELDSLVEGNLGHHSNGLLLGASFFQNFIVQLDYPNKKMRLITRDSVNMYDVANVRTVVQQGSGMPIAQIEINGKAHWLLIDTGNSGSLFVDRKVASRVGLLDKVEATSESYGVNGSGVNEFATADTVKFGPYEISDVKVSFPTEGQKTHIESQYKELGSRLGGKKVVGLIGYDLLKDFIVTLEYSTAKMHIGLPE
ncbi:MAG: aspartyl protease family protein [Pseudomonadota bacterium]|nr:aspartyl protease family protein [Pseudomonadota bacterium]